MAKSLLYICKTCGCEFSSNKKDKSRIPQYCSRQCSVGRQITSETRAKQAAAKRGKTTWNKGVEMWSNRPHPRGTLGMKFPHRSGDRSHFWRGGVSTENEKVRKSAEYKQWRQLVFYRDDFTCQICKEKGGNLHADHIKTFAYHPELRLDISNGRTLCVDCHYKTDTYGSKAVKYAEAGQEK